MQDGETGYSIPSDDPQALAEKLSALVTNRKLKKEWAKEHPNLLFSMPGRSLQIELFNYISKF